MNRESVREGRIAVWLVWIGNWGLALAGLGCLPAQHGDVGVCAEPAR